MTWPDHLACLARIILSYDSATGFRYLKIDMCAFRYGGGSRGWTASRFCSCSAGVKWDVKWIVSRGGDGVDRIARLDRAAKDEEEEIVDNVR